MMLKRHIWVFCWVGMCIGASSVGAHTLQGFVREAGTRRSLPGAQISWNQGAIETYSDENGFFVLEVPESNGATIEIRIDNYGYFALEKKVVLRKSGDSTDAAFFMQKNKQQKGATIVRERRRKDNQVRGSHRIEGKTVNEMAGTFGDPAKAIENFPGNGRVKRSQGSLFVRGAQPNQTAVYVDEFSVPDLYHFTGSTSVINIPFVESVELVPGVYSARFGRAVGGLVRLKTRKLPTDDVHGFAKVDLIDGGLYVGVPLSKNAALGASGRHSYLHLYREQEMQEAEPSDKIYLIPSYWDYQLKLDWDVSPGHELVLFGFGSGDRESYLRNESALATAYQRIRNSDFHRLALRYKHPIASGLKNTFMGVVGYETRNYDEMWSEKSQDQESLDGQFREELNWKMGPHRFSAGLNATKRTDTFSFRGDWTRSHILGYTLDRVPNNSVPQSTTVETLTSALFSEAILVPTPRWIIVPGFRLQNYWLDESHNFSMEPRLATDLLLQKGRSPLTLKAGVGLFSQAAPEVERAVAQLEGFELPLQKSVQTQIGLSQSVLGFWDLRSTLYWIKREEQIQRSETFPASSLDQALPFVPGLGGQSLGMEVLVRFQNFDGLQAWLSYGLARHEISADQGERVWLDNNDVTHFLVGVLKTQWDFGLSLGSRFRLSTGMPRTDVLTGSWNVDDFSAVPQYGSLNSKRYDNFGAIDLRLDYQKIFSLFAMDIYLDVANIFNFKPQEGINYSEDYLESEPLLGFSAFPNLGVKFVF